MVKEVKIDKMDDLIEALGGGGGGSDIPTPTVQDDGKILSVAGGEYILAETHGGFVPNASSSDDGKVLTAIYDDKSGNCNAEWVTPLTPTKSMEYNEYPSTSSATYSGMYELTVKSGAVIRPGFIVTCNISNSVTGDSINDLNISNSVFQSSVAGTLIFPTKTNLCKYLVTLGIISSEDDIPYLSVTKVIVYYN